MMHTADFRANKHTAVRNSTQWLPARVGRPLRTREAVILCSLTLRVEQFGLRHLNDARLGESSYGKTDRPFRA